MDGRRVTRRDSVCSRSSFDQISPTFSARLQYFFSDLTTEPILLVVAVMAQLCGNRRLEYLFGLPHEEPSMVSTIRRTADGISVRGFSRYLPLCIPLCICFRFLGVAHKRSANLFALRGASFALVLWTLGRPVSICTQADPLPRLISPLCRLPQLANGGRTQQRCQRFGYILTNVPVSGSTFTPRSHSVRGLLRCNLSTRRSRSLSGFAEQPSLAYGCASHARIPVPTNRLYSG